MAFHGATHGNESNAQQTNFAVPSGYRRKRQGAGGLTILKEFLHEFRWTI
jgi:hypothetical protein